MRKKLLLVLLSFVFMLQEAAAHCPLCTVGAAAAAGGAAWLGVSNIVIGVFIGGFASSTGWWASRLIKKNYIPYQTALLVITAFAATILPISAIVSDFHPIYISLAGGYGSLLNRTYLVDLFVVGALIGGSIVSVAPRMSKQLTKFRNGKMIPFQGVTLTFVLLTLAGAILQLVF